MNKPERIGSDRNGPAAERQTPERQSPDRLGDVDRAADAEAVVSAVEGEIREFVRRDVSTFRRPHHMPEIQSEAAAENIAQLIQRVSGASVTEVERVINELSILRDTLRAEGERVQRDITSYASLCQAALTSTKIIADSLNNWKPNQQPPQTQPPQTQSPPMAPGGRASGGVR